MSQVLKTSDQKHIRAASFVSISAFLLNAVFGIINYQVGNNWIAAENLLVAAAFGATYLLNRDGYHSSAPVLMSLLFLGHQGFATYIVGFQSGSHLYFLLGAIGAFLIFRRSQLPIASIFAFISGAGFLACVYFQDQLPMRYFIGTSESLELLNAFFVLITLFAMTAFFVTSVNQGEAALEAANARIDNLLRNVLPEPVADRLTADPENRIADHFDSVSVGFLDIVGFTAQASTQRPEETIAMLDKLFSEFDLACENCGVLKIKTIGDGYMFASGLPDKEAGHQVRVVNASLAFIRIAREQGVDVRVGAHCGEVVAGVIGRIRFQYDILGDTTNIAARMEATGQTNALQVSEVMLPHIENRFDCEPRGTIPVKGKGKMKTWIVNQPQPSFPTTAAE